ncbi:septum site-determining protein MinD [Saliterribacillus persicus]|uniref:Septum site-determining protein MinD n=2 Tax=Saliterribacillus persicus TaxID=930114 RepID=A0A368YAY3_9BACI|nr:septum site-determining protein MinD [Saliterribacillus persicus]
MGLESRIISNVVDVLTNRCKLNSALIKDKNNDLYLLLPAAIDKRPRHVKSEEMRRLLIKMRNEFDYIIIDYPTGIGEGFESALKGADKAIVIIKPDTFSIRWSDAIIVALQKQFNIASQLLLINQLKPDLVEKGIMLDIDAIKEIFPVEVIGLIPWDFDLYMESLAYGLPVVKRKNLNLSIIDNFNRIARRLLDEDIPIDLSIDLGIKKSR